MCIVAKIHHQAPESLRQSSFVPRSKKHDMMNSQAQHLSVRLKDQRTPRATLTDLPTELLNQIVSHCAVTSVGHLSQSSRSLHEFVEREGWRTFTQTHFASLNPAPYWRDAARSCTTLSRNWQRRAFLATYLEPAGHVIALPSGQAIKKWRRPGGQTQGFSPAVDSYEKFIGNRWTDRRQVVAWSAGAELVVRVKVRDSLTEETHRTASSQDQRGKLENIRWWTYKPLSSVEGRDDITSIKISRKGSQKQNDIDSSEQIIVGTANGDLQMLEIPPATEGNVIKTYFVTNGMSVRSISLSSDIETNQEQPRYLAANLADSNIALYQVDSTQSKIAPVSEINAIADRRKGCRIWSTSFLDPKHLAVGLGPSIEPINIFEIRPEGIVEEPVRKICLSSSADALESAKRSSVYPIESLLDSNGGKDGHLFLSGGYDGIVRLHDLRSPSSFTATYHDPTDDAAIYSLLSRGRDRVVAGTSRHGLLKIFDLRMSGSSIYEYAGVMGGHTSDSSTGDWNLFINPRDRYANSSWRGPNSWMRRSAEGSVYSLSSPSPTSPFVFAGVENAVVEFNFSSVLDKHPDPIFLESSDSLRGQRASQPSYLQQKRDILNLAMYSQGTDGSTDAMKLRLQRSAEETLGRVRNLVGLDERWKDNTQ
jgi:WD40 repeat protein